MSFEKFKILGYELTEAEVQEFEKVVITNYKTAIKNINDEVKKQYALLAGVDPQNAGYYNELLKYNRLDSMQRVIIKEYTRVVGLNRAQIVQALKTAFSNNYYRQQYANQWIATGATFKIIPNSIIELSVFSTANKFKALSKSILEKWGGSQYLSQHATLSRLILKHKTQDISDIIDAITQNLKSGNGYRVAAKSIRDIIGSYAVKDGVITASGAMANAIRIIRTESNRVMNDSAYAAQKALEQQGIDVKKMWSATLDGGTRPVHGSLDGQIQLIDEPFKKGGFSPMRPGAFGVAKQDINCRCTTVDIINDEKPTARRGRNPVTGENELFEYKDFSQWAKDNNLKKNAYGQIIA